MEKPVKVSKLIFSNCLIEALKAKLHDWKNIKIIYLPKKYSFSSSCHFMWQDLKTKKIYEFSGEIQKPNVFQIILENGFIYEMPLERHVTFIRDGIERFASNVAKKYSIETRESENKKFKDFYDWKNVDFYGLPNVDDLNGEKSFIGVIEGKPQIFELFDDNYLKSRDKITEWKPIF